MLILASLLTPKMIWPSSSLPPDVDHAFFTSDSFSRNSGIVNEATALKLFYTVFFLFKHLYNRGKNEDEIVHSWMNQWMNGLMINGWMRDEKNEWMNESTEMRNKKEIRKKRTATHSKPVFPHLNNWVTDIYYMQALDFVRRNVSGIKKLVQLYLRTYIFICCQASKHIMIVVILEEGNIMK